MRIITQILLIICFTSLSSFQVDLPERVSFIRLLASPDVYHGKKVMVSGFLHLDFEDYGLYLSSEHGNYMNTENAFWVSFSKDVLVRDEKDKASSLEAINRKNVIVVGVFNKDKAGHLSLFSGEIENIEKVYQQRKWYKD